MEYADRGSLEDRMTQRMQPGGWFTLDEALGLSRDIALGLKVAHAFGIAHRDLKPGNVMLTKNGARLLDFGLARRTESETFDADAKTERTPLTEAGAVVGTLQYMSPEQLRGAPLDARTDVFSFGAMLYEMLTGRRAFAAETRTEVTNAILERDPEPLSRLDPSIPPALDRAVAKCLEKNPEDRWQSARDLGAELRWIAGSSSGAIERSGVTRPTSRPPRAWIGAAVAGSAIVAALAFFAGRALHTPAATKAAIRFGVNPPPGASFAYRSIQTELAVSPDGSLLAFCALEGGRWSLYVRRLDELDARPIAGTDGAMSPFWSPDSKWIGFFAGHTLKKVALDTGLVQTIAQVAGGTGTWNSRGTILFTTWGPDTGNSILAVSDGGGPIRELTKAKDWNFWPSFLPDGRHFLYVVNTGGPRTGIFLASLDEPQGRQLVTVASRGEATRDGWIYYVREGSLVKQRLDVDGARLTGEASVVAPHVFQFTPTSNAAFSIDASGDVVAYQPTPSATQLVAVDFDGHELARLGTPLNFRKFQISPDGRRIAFDRFEESSGVANVWTYDIDRNVATRVTDKAFGAFAPIWTVDGRDLICTAEVQGDETNPPQLTRVNLASGAAHSLMTKDGIEYPTDTTPDGSAVLFTINRGNNDDIELLSLAGDGKKRVVEGSSFEERDGVLSADGQWLAFVSDESGSPEVYVRPFGREGEKSRVSTDGGLEQHFAPGARELYYLSPGGIQMRAAISSGSPLQIGRPQPMFHVSSAGMTELQEIGSSHYDVAPDGKRLILREVPRGVDPSRVVVITGAK
jgi:Tol biopolymer transport system component